MLHRGWFHLLGSACTALMAVAAMSYQGANVALFVPYIVFLTLCLLRFEGLSLAQKADVLVIGLILSATILYLLDQRLAGPFWMGLDLTAIVIGPSLPFVYAAWLAHQFPQVDPYEGVGGPSKTLDALLESKRLRAATVLGVRKPFLRLDPFDEPMF